MKNIIRKITAAVLLIATMISSFGVPVQAANVCNSVSGNIKNSVTFTVETGYGWFVGQYLTLNQSKGAAYTGNYAVRNYKTFTYNVYGTYTVTVKKLNGNKKTTTYTWSGKSKKIKLDKKSKYQITITPCTSSFLYNSGRHFLRYQYKNEFLKNWKYYPAWNVKKTKNLTMCR